MSRRAGSKATGRGNAAGQAIGGNRQGGPVKAK